jgi:hypothetical protein
MQPRLHAAGREQGTAAAELAVVEQELAQFGALPADVVAAAAATQAEREEQAPPAAPTGTLGGIE